MKAKIDRAVHYTRFYRKLHKWIAVPLFVFLTLIGATGLLLGIKKQTGILPSTQQGSNLDQADWMSIDALLLQAQSFIQDSLKLSNKIDRLDIRPAKGVAKVVFKEHFTELQLDLATGKVLAINTRSSDFIEKLHDGSILDFLFKTNNDGFKLFYTICLSLGLMLLSFSGFWLWYNPKRIRNWKHEG